MTISIERLNILRQTFKATAKVSEALEAAALNDAAAAISELLAVREAQSVPIGCIKTICGNKTLKWWRDAPEGAEVFTVPPAPTLPANVIGRPATPDDSPYPATISGGCLLAQAWADGYNVRNAVTAAPESLDDTRRMDWLVAHHVEVRKPLLYGSEKFFTAQTMTDEEDDYHATSLREQIDAAMAAAPTPTNKQG